MITTFLSEMSVLGSYIFQYLSEIWAVVSATILIIPIVLFVLRRVFRLFEFLTG